MRREIDLSKTKDVLGGLLKGLRGNRLWPLAIVLLVAIVAVPIALSKSSTGTPIASIPSANPPPSAGRAIPALNVQTTAGKSRLPGHGRDPFAGQASPKSTSGKTHPGSTSGSAGSTGKTGAGATAGAGTPASTGAIGATNAPPTSSSTPPPSITPNKKPTPAPSGLTGTQSYGVTLAMTASGGGLNTIDPLERLSPLPSENQPLLVELGVLKGGHRVLFAVQPGTAVNGSGTCTPGPIDCEILSLGQDQTEGVSIESSSGPAPVASFAVTGISAVNHPSAAAADKARRQESALGRRILDVSTLSALSLFQYQPNLGAVVDLSNLTARDP